MPVLSEIVADQTRQDNITRILDAAEGLFRHFGYSKTNVADIARELGMSPANIYRFFASKTEIHQALCDRMLANSYQMADEIFRQPVSASERLRRYVHAQFQMTVELMLDDTKVHEMVVVAIEREWHCIDRHISRIDARIADVIREGIAAGEFREQDADLASRCFGAATISLCHPQMVAQCLNKSDRVGPDELIDFAIRALKA
ncbi:TetR family transcriptional regulator [Ensifer sp.]|jgi:AcrR family transcriptional regulator|uniref:TetR family transcriptional regulator n=1 Tax=Ensifer sp. TaxID=1872086 RepID=UPI002E154E6D|nr:TetR family transcriptional regulator [Ensifer sp.]